MPMKFPSAFRKPLLHSSSRNSNIPDAFQNGPFLVDAWVKLRFAVLDRKYVEREKERKSGVALQCSSMHAWEMVVGAPVGSNSEFYESEKRSSILS